MKALLVILFLTSSGEKDYRIVHVEDMTQCRMVRESVLVTFEEQKKSEMILSSRCEAV